MKQLIQGLGLTLTMMMAPHATLAAGPAPVDLGTAARFAILAAAAISSTGGGAVNGDVGLSPATGANLTGMSTNQVNGIIYVVDAVGPAGSVMDPASLTHG